VETRWISRRRCTYVGVLYIILQCIYPPGRWNTTIHIWPGQTHSIILLRQQCSTSPVVENEAVSPELAAWPRPGLGREFGSLIWFVLLLRGFLHSGGGRVYKSDASSAGRMTLIRSVLLCCFGSRPILFSAIFFLTRATPLIICALFAPAWNGYDEHYFRRCARFAGHTTPSP
jgi:hypothetical protein